MNINNTASCNFYGSKIPVKVTKFSIPARTGTNMNFEVTGQVGKTVTALKYKLGDVEKTFADPNGIAAEKFDSILDEISACIQEGKDFLMEFLRAQKSLK